MIFTGAYRPHAQKFWLGMREGVNEAADGPEEHSCCKRGLGTHAVRAA